MIAWLNSAALVGLFAAVVPVLIHLLRRHQARRVVVPTVRFVLALPDSAVRVRRLSDPWLLLVRVGIVAAAALALARPLLITDARVEGWGSRVARVIVVDSSPSVDAPQAEEFARAEARSSAYPLVIRSADLPTSLARASAWLGQAPPARREVVVVSDFAHGVLTSADAALVPEGIGLRFARTAARQVDPAPLVDRVLMEGGVAERRIRLNEDATRLQVSSPSGGSDVQGLRVVADDRAAASRLIAVVARAGAPAPDPSRPLVVVFGPREERGGDQSPAATWMPGVGRRLLAGTEEARIPVSLVPSGPELLVRSSVEPSSFEAAVVLKAALEALTDPAERAEREVRRIPAATLDRWSRPPAVPPTPQTDRSQRLDDSDGRWLWALALVLIVIEWRMRRRTEAVHTEGARAA